MLTEIATNNAIVNKAAARTAFLAAIHKEIAIAKIDAFLARLPAVDVADLPVRAAGDVAANALARTNDNEYQTYPVFIRNHAAYTAAALNAFVSELDNAKTASVALTQIDT